MGQYQSPSIDSIDRTSAHAKKKDFPSAEIQCTFSYIKRDTPNFDYQIS